MQITVWAVYIALFQTHNALKPRGKVETQSCCLRWFIKVMFNGRKGRLQNENVTKNSCVSERCIPHDQTLPLVTALSSGRKIKDLTHLQYVSFLMLRKWDCLSTGICLYSVALSITQRVQLTWHIDPLPVRSETFFSSGLNMVASKWCATFCACC